MSEAYFVAGEGDLFVQLERSEVPRHLTCVEVGDLPLNQGDLTPDWCPDLAQKGKFKIKGFTQGTPATNTVTLRRPLAKKVNFLLEVKCPFVGWVAYGCASRMVEDYILGVIVYGMRVSNSSILSAAVAMTPDANTQVNTNAEVAYQDRMMVYRMGFDRQGISNTADANAVAFLPERCGDKCGGARGLCEEGYMALTAGIYDAEVKYTKNGNTWVEVAVAPFDNGGSASWIILLEKAGGHRAVISRGLSIVNQPAEVAIYENWAFLKNVDVGNVDGQTIQRMFAYGGKIWAAASGGYIYRSDTSGDTWQADEDGNETTEQLNDVVMYDTETGYAVGSNNAFLYTTNGEDWDTRPGPVAATNLYSVAVNDEGHVLVGAGDGNIYRSEDGGVTWEVATSFGNGSVNRIVFPEKTNRYVGFAVFNNAAGVGYVYRSKFGGASWELLLNQTGTWNSGINDVFPCDQNNAVAVGDAHGGTTFVAKTSVV